jgi:hypothetical protein
MEAAGIERSIVSDCGGRGSENQGPAGGAESGAVGTGFGPIDPDLAALIDAWPRMPEAVKAKIVAMVKTAGRE